MCTSLQAQRRTVERALGAALISGVQVNTTEKLQGQERDVVVSCFAPTARTVEAEPGFELMPERINTAITRAKKKHM